MPIYGKKSIAAIDKAVSDLEPFKLNGGSMSGWKTDTPGFGRLPESERDAFRNQKESHGVEFVIFSYATPIAWKLRNGNWFVPDVSYSTTTSGHQSAVKRALIDNGWVHTDHKDPLWNRNYLAESYR